MPPLGIIFKVCCELGINKADLARFVRSVLKDVSPEMKVGASSILDLNVACEEHMLHLCFEAKTPARLQHRCTPNQEYFMLASIMIEGRATE